MTDATRLAEPAGDRPDKGYLFGQLEFDVGQCGTPVDYAYGTIFTLATAG